jgi:hypothetical protein
MINEESYTLEWIEQKVKENKKTDPQLIEKTIRAFSLLEHLRQSGLGFIFKGGTSLMLLLDEAKRLSIDVDILIPADPGNIDEILESIQAVSPFNERKLLDRKQVTKIVKQHYKIYYEPAYQTQGDKASILLDIVFEDNPYSELVEKEIISPFLKTTGQAVTVKIPSVKSVLADKLTAYPPNTTGIPYEKNGNEMGLQIIKQLFDISRLIDNAEDLVGVRDDFDRIAATELEYREAGDLTPADVLQDIHSTSLCIATLGKDGKGNFPVLQRGIKSLGGFIFDGSITPVTLTSDAAKAAYLSACLQTETTSFEKFEDPAQVDGLKLVGKHHQIVERFQRTNPEAYFYWYHVSNLLGE